MPDTAPELEAWAEPRLDDLHALVDDALPAEGLAPDDLGGVVFAGDVPRLVLGTVAGDGAIALAAHGDTGTIDLLAVRRDRQRAGLGTALVDAGCRWLRAQGCATVLAGGSPPRYLWAGVDRTWIGALALLERSGFSRGAAILNLSCPTDPLDHRAAGATVARVGPGTAAAVLRSCEAHHPQWTEELAHGIERRGAFVAVDDADGEVLGFACHGVWRSGWFGPMASFPAGTGRGIGSALFAAALADMREEGHARCEISWVGPVAFYARVADVSAGRAFVVHRKRLTAP